MQRAQGPQHIGLAGTLLVLIASCTGSIEDGRSVPGSGAPGAADDGAMSVSNKASGTNNVPGRNVGTGATSPGSTAPNGSAANSGWPAFGDSQAYQLRRLTSEQYTATVQALLGVDTNGMPPIERVSPVGGFSEIGASTVSVSSMGVSQFEDAARYVAAAAFASDGPGRMRMPCTPSGASDTACFTSFVKSFGQKAFRRPLTDDEVSRYSALTAQIASDTQDPWQGLEAIVSAFLQSPNFLYLAEVGEPDPSNAKRYRYGDYEMASRLSYFLTGSSPDDQLLTAAGANKLHSADDVATQVKRLLASSPAHDSVARFFSSLLTLDNLDTLTRPTELFPQFTPTLGAAMKQETLRVIDDLVFASDGDYRHLFDQTDTFVNTELATLYGVDKPKGDDFVRVTLPASSHRAGLLGQAGVLAARDHSDETSPTRRGLFVLTRLLCQNLPLMPPAGLQIPQPPTGLITARQRLEEHTSNAVCASCHRVTDPVGLSLEHFDAMGVYREDDRGLTIDDTGMIDGATYHGETELGALLRDHPALGPCLIQSLYGVAVGHLATNFDQDTFAALVQGFDDSGARVRALLASIAASDGFRYLPVPTGN